MNDAWFTTIVLIGLLLGWELRGIREAIRSLGKKDKP